MRRIAIFALASLLIVAACTTDDDARTTTTTAAPTTTTTVAPTTTTPDTSSSIWPPPGSTTRFADPRDAARRFATDFAGFKDPVVGEYRAGDARSGEVEVRPTARGPVTTVLVRQLTQSADWSVIGATTAMIEVSHPTPGTVVTSPVRLEGRAWTFEGHVDVDIREDGNPTPLGTTFVTGRGDAMGPFRGSLEFRAPSRPAGTLVFHTSSAEDGRIWQVTAFRVRFAAD